MPVPRTLAPAMLLLTLLTGGCSVATDESLGSPYPSYNVDPLAPDAQGMGDGAQAIASKIQVGFNIGNTLEATGGETAWGNPVITPAFVSFVKQTGFSALRLPVSWNDHADPSTARIDATWLARVKDVVQYAVDAGLYVIVNAHWDGGWLENHVTEADRTAVLAKQKAFWEQIATELRGFDDHVLFASANEPNVADAAQMKVLLAYHQAFIDAVRSTGGRNTYRTLVVQGPSTDIEKTNQLMTGLPVDPTPGRLMVEVHDYSPWNFTGMTQDESWGKQFYYWGKGNHSTTDPTHNPTWGEEEFIDTTLAMMKTQFVDRGIPVVIGEFGAQRRTNLTGDALQLHLASRVSYFGHLSSQARANGLLPFVWDTGSLLDRRNQTVLDPDVVAALLN
ncbi:MAG TPA: glycoside hydrolase family 5 protein [Spirochaetia bacterium]|nr:glycoside hydrolase family 5 protein [Spirochaetia bacterium]